MFKANVVAARSETGDAGFASTSGLPFAQRSGYSFTIPNYVIRASSFFPYTPACTGLGVIDS
jgi:hypothetical protein